MFNYLRRKQKPEEHPVNPKLKKIYELAHENLQKEKANREIEDQKNRLAGEILIGEGIVHINQYLAVEKNMRLNEIHFNLRLSKEIDDFKKKYLNELISSGCLRIATQKDLEDFALKYVDKYGNLTYRLSENLLYGHKYNKVYIAKKDCTIIDYCGASSFWVIVPDGITISFYEELSFRGRGHCAYLYHDDLRIEGIL
jgi:hypothetical protein